MEKKKVKQKWKKNGDEQVYIGREFAKDKIIIGESRGQNLSAENQVSNVEVKVENFKNTDENNKHQRT